MHLKRGGRVSAATAVVGTMLQIKPVIIMNDEGRLDTVAKARGRKSAISMLVQKLQETGIPGANEMVFLGHGDCPEEAHELAQQLKDKCGVKHVIISHVGNVIGSHTGPDVLVITFLGRQRNMG
jgi:DegV family protein with EDD domain